mmetsp:Transcript_6353/g.20058  ORF Transcript_6353/g.20058 Transcript_6353/m.20058 type:complete len:228 (+) Transcript_6353:2176-2859(+)
MAKRNARRSDAAQTGAFESLTALVRATPPSRTRSANESSDENVSPRPARDQPPAARTSTVTSPTIASGRWRASTTTSWNDVDASVSTAGSSLLDVFFETEPVRLGRRMPLRVLDGSSESSFERNPSKSARTAAIFARAFFDGPEPFVTRPHVSMARSFSSPRESRRPGAFRRLATRPRLSRSRRENQRQALPRSDRSADATPSARHTACQGSGHTAPQEALWVQRDN